MKLKSFSKKLTLNKKTVANLGQDQMSMAVGGNEPNSVSMLILCYPCDSKGEKCETIARPCNPFYTRGDTCTCPDPFTKSCEHSVCVLC